MHLVRSLEYFLFTLSLQVHFLRAYIAQDGLWTGRDFTQGQLKVVNGIVVSDNADIQRILVSAEYKHFEGGEAMQQANVNRVKQVLTQQEFENLFPERNAEYTYDRLLKAVASFPKFCDERRETPNSIPNIEFAIDACKRELATLFAHMTYVTNKRDPLSPDNFEQQGLYYLEDPDCAAVPRVTSKDCAQIDSNITPLHYPSVGGAEYYGRGSFMAQGNEFYARYGSAVKLTKFDGYLHFLNSPEEMKTGQDGFRSALFGYMTPDNPVPSLHDIVTGLWIPSLNESTRHFGNDFGTTVFALRKYDACGSGYQEKAQALEHASYYEYFLQQLSAQNEDLTIICKDMNQNWPTGGMYGFSAYIQKDYQIQNEGQFQSYLTKYSVYVKDDYKRCICREWGAGESDCPQDTSCTWSTSAQTESSTTLSVPVYAGTTQPLDLTNTLKNLGLTFPSCTSDGSPPDFFTFSLILDKDTLSSQSASFGPKYGHKANKDSILSSDITSKHLAYPLNQLSLLVDYQSDPNTLSFDVYQDNLFGLWVFQAEACKNQGADINIDSDWDCSPPRLVTINVLDPCTDAANVDPSQHNLPADLCPEWIVIPSPQPQPTPDPNPVIIPDNVNTAPTIDKWLDKNFLLLSGTSDSNASGNFVLPDILDAENDAVTVRVTFPTKLKPYSQQSGETLIFTNVPVESQGLNQVQIELDDGQLQTQYTLFVFVQFDITQEEIEEESDDSDSQDQDENNQNIAPIEDGESEETQSQEDEKSEEEKQEEQSIQNALYDFEKLIMERLERKRREEQAKGRNYAPPIIVPPIAEIKEFSEIGKLVLSFSQPMIVPQFLVDQIQASSKKIEKRNLQEVEIKLDIGSLISHDLERGSEDSAPREELQYKIKLQQFEENQVILKFEFENPLSVSIGSKKDKMHIWIKNNKFFTSETSNKRLEGNKKYTIEIPRQFPDELEYEIAKATGNAVQVSTNSAFAAQFAVTLVLAVSLKSVWNLNHVMQVLAYFRHFTNWTANAMVLMQSMHNAITLENISEAGLDYATESLELAKEKVSDENLQAKGINDPDFFKSLGLFTIILVVMLALLGIYYLIKLCSNVPCFGKIKILLKKKLFYSSWIRYLIESNLKVTHNSIFFLAITGGFSDKVQSVKTIIQIVIIAIVFAWPFFLSFFIIRHRSELGTESFKERFGSMYQGNKTERISYLLYHPVFCFRRLCLVLSLLLLDGMEDMFVIYAVLFIHYAYLMYMILVVPHEDDDSNNLEFINEVTLILIAYLMQAFTAFTILHPSEQWVAGYLVTASFLILFACNYFVMIKSLVVRLRNLYRKKKQAQKVKQMQMNQSTTAGKNAQRQIKKAVSLQSSTGDGDGGQPQHSENSNQKWWSTSKRQVDESAKDVERQLLISDEANNSTTLLQVNGSNSHMTKPDNTTTTGITLKEQQQQQISDEDHKLISLARQIELEMPQSCAKNRNNEDYESISSLSDNQKVTPIHPDLLLVGPKRSDYQSEQKQTEEDLLTDRYRSVDQGFETARNEEAEDQNGVQKSQKQQYTSSTQQKTNNPYLSVSLAASQINIHEPASSMSHQKKKEIETMEFEINSVHMMSLKNPKSNVNQDDNLQKAVINSDTVTVPANSPEKPQKVQDFSRKQPQNTFNIRIQEQESVAEVEFERNLRLLESQHSDRSISQVNDHEVTRNPDETLTQKDKQKTKKRSSQDSKGKEALTYKLMHKDNSQIVGKLSSSYLQHLKPLDLKLIQKKIDQGEKVKATEMTRNQFVNALISRRSIPKNVPEEDKSQTDRDKKKKSKRTRQNKISKKSDNHPSGSDSTKQILHNALKVTNDIRETIVLSPDVLEDQILAETQGNQTSQESHHMMFKKVDEVSEKINRLQHQNSIQLLQSSIDQQKEVPNVMRARVVESLLTKVHDKFNILAKDSQLSHRSQPPGGFDNSRNLQDGVNSHNQFNGSDYLQQNRSLGVQPPKKSHQKTRSSNFQNHVSQSFNIGHISELGQINGDCLANETKNSRRHHQSSRNLPNISVDQTSSSKSIRNQDSEVGGKNFNLGSFQNNQQSGQNQSTNNHKNNNQN